MTSPLHVVRFNQDTSLIGTADPAKFIDPLRTDERDIALEGRRIHGPSEKGKISMKYTLIIVIISAIIFVTVISLYDVARNILSYYYSVRTVRDSTAINTPDNITNTEVGGWYSLMGITTFAIFCIITVILLLPILILMLEQ